MRENIKSLLIVLTSVVLAGCGGSGDNNSSIEIEQNNTANANNEEATPVQNETIDTPKGVSVIASGSDRGEAEEENSTTSTPSNTAVEAPTPTSTLSVSNIPFPTMPTDINLSNKYIPPQL